MRLVLVVGDAGIGKTRFVAEGMRVAAAGGLVPVLGGCLPLTEKLPLLPVAGALGELGGLDGGAALEAALGSAPPYVRVEVGRLLPQLGQGDAGAGGRAEGWWRERLFAAVADLLATVARGSPVALVIEDVHWADGATLDCLTFLTGAGRLGAVTVVVTCRSDEVPLDPQVAAWLAHVRGSGGVVEITLGPLSRGETAEQAAGLLGGPPPCAFADDLYARAEGNPFFTEQLVAAARPAAEDGAVRAPAGLPARLSQLLVARAGRRSGDARAVLAALAVAGRPLTEAMLGGVTGLDVDAVRVALRELAAARLLADTMTGGALKPRHALLAEAVAGGLLPGEKVALHEQVAQALRAGGPSLAAEAAGHWAAAGRPAEELPARVVAGEAAERVFGYAEAAAHWQRAIDLCQVVPGTASTAGIDLPRLYVRAIDALDASGDGDSARALADNAYRQFADHPDPATAAVIMTRAAHLRWLAAPAEGLPLIQEALRLFAQAPPSADYAEAWLEYATSYVFHAEGRPEDSRIAATRALEIADAAGATAVVPRILAFLAVDAFIGGQVEEGFTLLRRGRAMPGATDGENGVWLDAVESDALLKTGKFQAAAEVALTGIRAARQTGRDTSPYASVLPGNAAEALLAAGRTSEAATLIDPLTTGPPEFYHLVVHLYRAEIDLLRGDVPAATERQQQIHALLASYYSIDHARETAQRAAELALWAQRPADAVEEVQRILAKFESPDLTVTCGRLLAAGMRACADLAEQARARRDDHAASAAQATAGELGSWVNQMGGAPFASHPFMATNPAERATWDAERTRLTGPSDPAAWGAAAKIWNDLGCPHRAGYASWRQAQAQLDAGQPAATAATALRAAAVAADGHAPLSAQIRALAQRARIPLPPPPATSSDTAAAPGAAAPYGLTGREQAVLRLVAAGRTNAQIGAELYISPTTAGVHVSNILRKLGVTSRVQAAAVAERAGLLDPGQP